MDNKFRNFTAEYV